MTKNRIGIPEDAKQLLITESEFESLSEEGEDRNPEAKNEIKDNRNQL